MKQSSDIQDLLDRYWEGETSLDDERRIKAFFAAQTIPEKYRELAPFFQALRAEQALEFSGKQPQPVIGRSNIGYRLAAAAVAILLTAGTWWWMRPQDVAVPEQAQAVPTTPVPEKQVDLQETKLAETEVPAPVLHAEVKPVVKRNVRRAVPKAVKSIEQPVVAVEDTYDDPEAALAEIKAALALVSSKINRSKQTIDKGLQEVEHVDVLLKKKKETNG